MPSVGALPPVDLPFEPGMRTLMQSVPPRSPLTRSTVTSVAPWARRKSATSLPEAWGLSMRS